ncbi:CbbBc protein, partial [Pseudomonas sp. GW460-13]
VSINPLRERGVERFTSPQHPVEMLTGSSTKIASMFVQPNLGGDFALIKGMAKRLDELDEEAIRHGRERLIDVDFVREHTIGFGDFIED